MYKRQGQTWLDTECAPIQAHGGGFLQQTDTDGKPIYYWVGEDKSHNTSNFKDVYKRQLLDTGRDVRKVEQ